MIRIWQSLSRITRYQVMFFSFVTASGGACFLFAKYGSSLEARDFVMGLGIALIPTGILGLMHRLFFYDELRSEMDSILRSSLNKALETDLLPFLRSGITHFSDNRSELLVSFKDYIESETSGIFIIGSSLKGILDPDEEIETKKAFADLLRRKIADGVPVKFLLTHPALAFLREDAEGRAQHDIKNEIIATLEYLTRKNDVENGKPGLGVPYDLIKLYKGTPTIFSIITSDALFMNPYTYQSNAYESFCLEVKRVGPGDLYSRFLIDHFNKPWKDKRTTVTLSEQMLKELMEMTLQDIFKERQGDIFSNGSSKTSDESTTDEEMTDKGSE